MTSDVLLVGCGELGSAIGLRLADLSCHVAAIRRRAELVPPPLLGIAADLTREVPTLPPLDLQFLVIALTARPRSEQSYRETYVDGMGRALDALDTADQRPRRAVLVSSTGVYGDIPPTHLLGEDTPVEPSDGPARMLREAEQLFAERVPNGSVLRFSGLYGGDSTRLLDQVRDGQITDPNRWTNRIHRNDAADAVVHLLTMDASPVDMYVGTDDEPAQLGTVAAYLAGGTDAPTPPPADPAAGHGKRLSNSRLRATGWVPKFPTFREGYRRS